MNKCAIKLGDKVTERSFGTDKTGIVVSLPPISQTIAIIETSANTYAAVNRNNCTIAS